MFRELRRKNKVLSNDECVEILKNEKRGVLSVIGDGGYPYGVPMNHYYNEEDGNLYFHTGKGGHRNESLLKNNKASFTLYDSGYKKDSDWALYIKSVIVFGEVELIEDAEVIKNITKKLSYKFTSDEAYIEKEIKAFLNETVLLKLNIKHMCGKLIKES
ncbi:MAG: pyridoxamine 5'-phosphate oxidase family protein [Ruminococcaceae bacterium]|nr:pyridoxamine 5'-phosphate oxidase family protein [Oscillospiraceae bacterium]